MKKISPVGVYCVALFVKYWNLSSDTEEKKYVKEVLLSDEILKNQDCFSVIQTLTNQMLWLHQVQFPGLRWEGKIVGTLTVLFISAPEDRDFWNKEFCASMQLATDEAKSEVISYFAEMFKQGHLETIPMPEFAMIMPPENLASFQKFCAEQAQGLSEKEVSEIILPSSVLRFKKESSNSGLDTNKTPEQIIANAHIIASKLPGDLKFTIPPAQPENELGADTLQINTTYKEQNMNNVG